MQSNSSWQKRGVITLSAVLTWFAIVYTNVFVACFCMAPLFIINFNASVKAGFRSGLLFGLVVGVLIVYWMIPGTEKFTSNSWLYGVPIFLLSSVLFSLYFASIIFCFNLIRGKQKNNFSLWQHALLVACIWAVAETLLTWFAASCPWFLFHIGSAFIGNLYTIQFAAYTGVYGLTFCIVFINYLFAGYIVQRQWIQLAIPSGLAIAYLFSGWLIVSGFEKNNNNKASFTTAILSENISPSIKWDEKNGNELVSKLLYLSKEAARLQPDIALWSESVVPWTYKPDDDFIKAVLENTKTVRTTHIIGMNTDYQASTVLNSVYCLQPGNHTTERYDKQFPLDFIEKPVINTIIPFLSSNGYAVAKGPNAKPLSTPYGKAGIMICNESFIPFTSRLMVKSGAQFFFNVSNDGWFNNTYIVDHHLYNARLRAVETRKDIAVNSNNGICGFIRASGHIAFQKRSEDPYIIFNTITPNNYLTTVVRYPYCLAILCGIYIVLLSIKSPLSLLKF